MAMLVRAAVLMSPLLLCHAFLDLSGLTEIEGVWKGSTTVPCAYVPAQDFEQQTVTWAVEHDKISATIFRRDDSGDHILLSNYRDRVSVLKDTPGNVSLQILALEMSDRGTYTCQVNWRMSNNSLITREISTKLEVVKVPASKPSVRAGEKGLVVPAGSSASLTCQAHGSPPLRYRWYRGAPGETPQLLRSQPELAWGSLQPSDAGTYFCEAEARVGAAQRSDAVELVVTASSLEESGPPLEYEEHKRYLDPLMTTAAVPKDVGITRREYPTTDLPATAVTSENGVGYPEKNYTTHDFQRTHLPLYLVIVIAVACGAVVFLVIFLIICIRKPKEAQVYEVKFHNSRAAAASRCESAGHYEEPISFTENNYVTEPMKNKSSDETNMRKNEYDCVGNTQESEYEVGNTV